MISRLQTIWGPHSARWMFRKGERTSSASPDSRVRDGGRSLSFPTQKGGPTVKSPCLGGLLPRHGDFTVGPPFCVGKDRLRPPSRTQEPGQVLEVRLPFLDIHLAEWRPQIVSMS